MEQYLRSTNVPIMSLESQKPLSCFDIIGFSLLYELNYTNILTILDLAHIPFFAAERDDSYPLIIAGGPCACNPEPVADFFDAIVVGDGENVITDLSQVWLKWKESINRSKGNLLKMWSEIEGVYIPALFESEFDQNGFQALRFKNSDPPEYNKTISRAIVGDLDKAFFPCTPIIPFGKPVHDRLRLEVARGCTRGCRFCQAGVIYRPVRERSPATLLSHAKTSLASTGYEDISLLSLSTGDYGSIEFLMKHLMDQCKDKNIAVSLPSMRAGTLTPEMMDIIKKVRKTGFTIAPEAGSQRLRDVINKNITEKEIIDTVYYAFSFGWRVIKLYFMVGLPGETDDDLQSIVELVKNLKKIKGKTIPKKNKININVSVSTFIPKPHTPFQWASQISLADSTKKINWLHDHLKLPGIHFKWQNPKVSLLEGLWSRGDRRLSGLLVAAYKKGCKFDGWSDKFRFCLWQEALSDENVDIDFYTTRARELTEPLPWDHIDTKVSKKFLKKEWEKSLCRSKTSDCRTGDCNSCGVCDFNVVKPRTYEIIENKSEVSLTKVDAAKPFYKKLKILYSRKETSRYFGHLELVNIFLRAIRRAKIPVKYSEGFHPMPKVSFADPLPVGMESLEEILYLTVPADIKPSKVMDGLNNQLPTGLKVHGCETAPLKSALENPEAIGYMVTSKNGIFNKNDLINFKNSSSLCITRTNKKGRVKKIDLKEMVLKIDLPEPDKLRLILKAQPGKTIRPFDVITHLFNLPEEKARQVHIMKTGPEVSEA